MDTCAGPLFNVENPNRNLYLNLTSVLFGLSVQRGRAKIITEWKKKKAKQSAQHKASKWDTNHSLLNDNILIYSSSLLMQTLPLCTSYLCTKNTLWVKKGKMPE